MKDTYIPLFIAALFTIARTRKQPRCPSTDEWIKMLWYIYPMDYYLAIKRNTFESVLMRWMNLDPVQNLPRPRIWTRLGCLQGEECSFIPRVAQELCS